jgi:hypothetical protein
LFITNSDYIYRGFDVVIGNPPYISAVEHSKDNEEERKFYRTKYKQLSGAFDIYTVFLLKGIELSKACYCWIIPNKFLVSNYSKKSFEHLKNNGLYKCIDVSKFNVFKNASVYPIIIEGNKKENKFEKYFIEKISDLEKFNFKKEKELNKYKTFSEYGIQISSGATGFQAKSIIKNIKEESNSNTIPFIVSGSVDKYYINYNKVRYMGKTYNKAYISKGRNIADKKWDFWKTEKIIIAGMTKVIEATFCDKPLALGVGVYAIYDYSIFNKYFLLGILNSKFLTYYINVKFKDKHLAGGYLAINKSTIEQLPLLKPTTKQEKIISEMVCKILSLTTKENYLLDEQAQEQVKKYQLEIDKIVYTLYDLTQEEIDTIEKSL